jgi:AP2 domain-containing protein/HNH endonuclease
MKKIPVGKKHFALVDDGDYARLSKWKWKLVNGYAKRTDNRVDSGGVICMHRVVNQTPEGKDTDHKNLNKLDNRKSNLRTCTRSQNFMNRKTWSKSGYKGVCYDSKKGKWRAEAGPAGTKRWLGYHETKEEAALAYNRAAGKLYGDFAKLNNVASNV